MCPPNFSEVRSKEIELAGKDIPQRKVQNQITLTGKLYQIFKEDIIPILHNLVPKIEAEGTLLNSFYGTTVTLLPKSDKDLTEKKTTGHFSS